MNQSNPKLISIGDVNFTFKGSENPYVAVRKMMISGNARRALLATFRDDRVLDTFDVWNLPASGGARIIESPDEINWSGMS